MRPLTGGQIERMELWGAYKKRTMAGSRIPLNHLTLKDLQKLMLPNAVNNAFTRWSPKQVRRADDLDGPAQGWLRGQLPEDLCLLVNCWLLEITEAETDSWYRYIGRCARRGVAPDLLVRHQPLLAETLARKETRAVGLTPAQLRDLMRAVALDEGASLQELVDISWTLGQVCVVRNILETGGRGWFKLKRPLGWSIRQLGHRGNYLQPFIQNTLAHLRGMPCLSQTTGRLCWICIEAQAQKDNPDSAGGLPPTMCGGDLAECDEHWDDGTDSWEGDIELWDDDIEIWDDHTERWGDPDWLQDNCIWDDGEWHRM